MQNAKAGDRVRVDIPDKGDPDYRYHGEHGEVTEVLRDAAGASTGDERDSFLYRVQLDSGAQLDLRWRDLRPPLE